MIKETFNFDGIAIKAHEARCLTLMAIHAAGSGHPGGSLSCIDILSVLFSYMHYNPSDINLVDRDRFVLSKGHAAPALYAVAALSGYIPIATLNDLRKIGTKLQGHPHVGSTPWVESSTGSLGQGFSVALGMALGLRHHGINSRVFALLGDGEMQEGQVWEALMCAAHFRLSRLCAILDYNKLQSDDLNTNIMKLEPLVDKIRSFGWSLLEIDGHDFDAIFSAFEKAGNNTKMPTFILAHTVKGAGIDFMENRPEWHGSVKLSDDDLKRALVALGVADSEMMRFFNEKF